MTTAADLMTADIPRSDRYRTVSETIARFKAIHGRRWGMFIWSRVTAIVATIIASLLPLGLARLGADPALASGPVATVVQDILSVGIYLMIATALLPA